MAVWAGWAGCSMVVETHSKAAKEAQTRPPILFPISSHQTRVKVRLHRLQAKLPQAPEPNRQPLRKAARVLRAAQLRIRSLGCLACLEWVEWVVWAV